MFEKLRSYISEQLNIDENEITLDTSFRDDLGADSLDLFEMVLNLESEYGISIPVGELNEINTVGDVIDYLNAHGVE